jgi:hypothetical protein
MTWRVGYVVDDGGVVGAIPGGAQYFSLFQSVCVPALGIMLPPCSVNALGFCVCVSGGGG